MRTTTELDAMREKGQRAIQKKLRERYTALGFKNRGEYEKWMAERSRARGRLRHAIGGTYADASALYSRIEAEHPKKLLDVNAILTLAERAGVTPSPNANGTHAHTRRTPSTNGTSPLPHDTLRDEGEDATAQRAESFAAGYIVAWIEGYARQHGLAVGAFTERVGRLLQRAGRR